MALTQEDLQAIAALMDSKLEPIKAEQAATNARLDVMQLEPIIAEQVATNQRLDAMQADIDQIKEDTAITRATVNGLGEWTDIASDVLKIEYPLKKAE